MAKTLLFTSKKAKSDRLLAASFNSALMDHAQYIAELEAKLAKVSDAAKQKDQALAQAQ